MEANYDTYENHGGYTINSKMKEINNNNYANKLTRMLNYRISVHLGCAILWQ